MYISKFVDTQIHQHNHRRFIYKGDTSIHAQGTDSQEYDFVPFACRNHRAVHVGRWRHAQGLHPPPQGEHLVQGGIADGARVERVGGGSENAIQVEMGALNKPEMG